MDREAMARAHRRRQALDALEFERAREADLREQLEETVTELEGDRLDEAVFAKLAGEDVEVVRDALATASEGEDDSSDEYFGADFGEDFVAEDADGDPDTLEAEIARLEQELAECRRRQGAFERYLEALGA